MSFMSERKRGNFIQGLPGNKQNPLSIKRTWDAFYQTDLELVLQKHGIKSLIIAGMQT
jgi:nicotinamidase-related amidase